MRKEGRQMVNTTTVEWHDLKRDPDDLPDPDEAVLTTIENLEGMRSTRTDIYLKRKEDKHWWCTTAKNDGNIFEELVFWYPVVAWAELPEAYYM